jgi:hypothetical protein
MTKTELDVEAAESDVEVYGLYIWTCTCNIELVSRKFISGWRELVQKVDQSIRRIEKKT